MAQRAISSVGRSSNLTTKPDARLTDWGRKPSFSFLALGAVGARDPHGFFGGHGGKAPMQAAASGRVFV